MLDVHPPHASTHTWRDFFIHIATIVIGLLIAVGLEQTVEYVHHLHQRHELEQNLHDEAMRRPMTMVAMWMKKSRQVWVEAWGGWTSSIVGSLSI